MPRFTVSRAFLLAAIVLSQHAHAQPARSPASPDTPKPTALPAIDPTSPDFITRCVKAADYSARHAGRVVLIMHKGQVVFEKGESDWPVERMHPLASGTKSFTGVAAMFAVQDGLLTLDELASETLTEWKTDPRKARITIRQLLTLSSGLDPSDDTLGGRGGGRLLGPGTGRRDEPQQRDPRDEPGNLFASALGVPAVGEPGAKFAYGPSHFYAFGELLRRKLVAAKGPITDVHEYYEQKIFKPLGITFRVGKDRAGNPKLPGGAVLTAREWAAFGQFILLNGAKDFPAAEGKPATRVQLLKPDLLAECFKPSSANPAYGLTWWLLTTDTDGAVAAPADGPARAPDAPREALRERLRQRVMREEAKGLLGPDGKPLTIHMAAGLGKQRLFILPQYDLVIVRYAESSREGLGFSNADFLGLLLK